MNYCIALLTVFVASAFANDFGDFHLPDFPHFKRNQVKRSRACEDLASAVQDTLEIASGLSPEIAQYVTMGKFGVQHQFKFDPSNLEQLSGFLCSIEDASDVNALAKIIELPSYQLRMRLADAKQVWSLIGGAAGIRRLSEPLLRAAEAYERLGLHDLV